MDKQIITFTANEQCLRKTGGLEVFATKTVSYIEAHFDLGTNWSGYDSVRAVWWNDYVRPISTVLDSDGVCIVPTEVLLRKGAVYVNLVGSIAEGDVLTDRLTTIPITALVEKFNAHVDSTETAPITPSQFEQFVEAVKADADRAEDAKDDARGYASDAQTYAENASTSATNASTSEDNAKESELNAEAYKNQAQTYAQNAYNSSVSAESAKDDAILARDEIRNMSAEATTLPAGSDATASYSDGVLSLGIPKGVKGDRGQQGIQGETGATPNLTIGTVETLEPTEDATATITGTAKNPILNLGIPQGEVGEVSYADLKTLLPMDTASGAIVSITDGQPIIPVDSLKVSLEPIQDLHGYDKPWSGGAGDNKLGLVTDIDKTVAGVRFTFDADTGTFTVNGTNTNTSNHQAHVWLASASFFPNFQVGETYTLFVDNTSLPMYMQFTYKNTSDATRALGYCNFSYGHIAFTIPSDFATLIDFQMYIGGSATTLNATFHVWLVKESVSTSTFTPYSNICPISGYDSVEIWNDPKYGGTVAWNQLVQNGNFADGNNWKANGGTKSVANNVLTLTTTVSNNAGIYQSVPTISGHKYLLSGNVKLTTSASSVSMRWVLSNGGSGTETSAGTISSGVKTNSSVIVSPTSNWSRLYILTAYSGSGMSVGDTIEYSNFMCIDLTQMFGAGNEPTTVEEFKAIFPKDYYDYNAGETTCVSAVNGDPYKHYTTDLSGTRYGGTLDVVSGELVVDRAMVDLGTLTWTYDATVPRFYSTDIKTTVKAPLNNIAINAISSDYIATSFDNLYMADKKNGTFAVGATGTLSIINTSYTDATAFKTAMSGVQLCYELATPQTIQLTPQEVKLLLGNNTIWSDGDVAIVYSADVTKWIEKQLS